MFQPCFRPWEYCEKRTRNMERKKATNIMMKRLSCSSHGGSVCTVHLAASLIEPISQKSQAEMQILWHLSFFIFLHLGSKFYMILLFKCCPKNTLTEPCKFCGILSIFFSFLFANITEIIYANLIRFLYAIYEIIIRFQHANVIRFLNANIMRFVLANITRFDQFMLSQVCHKCQDDRRR